MIDIVHEMIKFPIVKSIIRLKIFRKKNSTNYLDCRGSVVRAIPKRVLRVRREKN